MREILIQSEQPWRRTDVDRNSVEERRLNALCHSGANEIRRSEGNRKHKYKSQSMPIVSLVLLIKL
jgi:hypothetical protein